MLQARFQLIGNYDPVRRSYRRIEQLEATLARPPLYLDRDFRERMTDAVARYRAVVTTKQHLIEDIKYQTLNLLDEARRHKTGNFVLASTSSVSSTHARLRR